MGERGYLSFLGTVMGLMAILDRLIPRYIWAFLERKMIRLLSWMNWQAEVRIDEFEGYYSNEIYELVELHIASLTSGANSRPLAHSARRLKLSQLKNASKPRYNPDSGQPIEEEFQGVTFRLEQEVISPEKSGGGIYNYFPRIRRYFIVTTHQRHKHTLLPRYLDYVIDHGKKLRHQNGDRKLFTNIRGGDHSRKKAWRSVPFKHASTFASLALSEKLREMIVSDLEAFMGGEEFFRRVGRAWKRGYLLHGPPGTGKSSLIAAIANYTQFDVYDLELTEVKSNAELRELLMGVSNKSIIVIEDIDCSLELKKRGHSKPEEEESGDDEEGRDSGKTKDSGKEDDLKSRVTLSGLLNFIDGLWSCIGDERIIIFTTNHKDKLDPALLRPGRMDLHILLSYCCFEAFQILAWTHLGVRQHRMFAETEALMEGGANMTPAEVAEILIQNRDDADSALEKLLEALEKSRANSAAAAATATGGPKTGEPDELADAAVTVD